ncbi:hypothetical protein ACW14Y_05015 [Kitasatospora sp. cg17-2]
MPPLLAKLLIFLVYTAVLGAACTWLVTALWGQLLVTALSAAVMAWAVGKVDDRH